MLAGGYTLLEQGSNAEFLPHCVAHGIDVVLASPFNSGILASGAGEGATYFYAPAPPPIVERVRSCRAICARHAVPLGAAALQFPLAHPAIVSVVAGYRSNAEIDTNLRWLEWPIPAALWDELRAERCCRPTRRSADAMNAAAATFEGFARPDGSVGVRNHVLVMSITGLTGPTARRIGRIVAGTKVIATPYGSGLMGEDADVQTRSLIAFGTHPNVGATLVIGGEPAAGARGRRRDRRVRASRSSA